jgi:hypothetical protein
MRSQTRGILLAIALQLPGVGHGTDGSGTAAATSAGSASRLADLEHAKADYVTESPAFSANDRETALAFVERSRPHVESMSSEAYLLCLLRVAAIADNGHDVLNDGDDSWAPSTRLPLRMIWFPDGWVVARAAPALADLPGARVLAIDGLSSDEIFRRLRPYWGGPDSSRRWNLEWIVEGGGLLHAAGLARQADALTLDLQLRDGRHAQRTLRFVPVKDAPQGRGPVRIWSPQLWQEEQDRRWLSYRPPSIPLFLADGDEPYRVVPLDELRALYIQFRSHLDRPTGALSSFITKVDEAIRASSPRYLIVDLRFDTGGNIDLTRAWQRTLPGRIPERIYVIVSRYTFSAGIVAAAALKHDGGTSVTIVGEPVGDRLSWWSEGSDVCLPGSHYCFHRTSGLWDLQHGCSDRPNCFGDSYDALVDGLDPDLGAPLTAADWLAGRDRAMEAVRADISRRPLGPAAR